MDIMGAQVAMQAADGILTDDYFASSIEVWPWTSWVRRWPRRPPTES